MKNSALKYGFRVQIEQVVCKRVLSEKDSTL